MYINSPNFPAAKVSLYMVCCQFATYVYVAICDRICQKGSYTRNYKSRFEILNTVYCQNAWCLIYAILHQSIVILGNSVGVELPAILDSLFHQYHK